MKIAVVGSYGVGLTMFSARLPRAGETISGGRFLSSHGGKGSNQAVGAARLGASVALLTAVGSDGYGEAARRLWAAEGIDASAVKVVDDPTMVGVILVDESGENRIIIAPGALDRLGADDVEAFRPQLAEADVVVVSLEIPLQAAAAALRVAKEEGTTTLLNPAPAAPLPDEVWMDVDVVTPNATEAPVILGLTGFPVPGPHELSRLLRERTGADVVMTLGDRGAIVCEGDGCVVVPAVPATAVVDTTGAGDAFTAALAVALATGLSLVASAGVAAAAGAHTVASPGVVPALPRLTDLRARGVSI
ncbi:MAG: ribokinase [Candidatus Limnocylindria bacterium]